MAVIFIFYVVQFEPVKYGTVEYPEWAHVIGIIFFQILSFKIETVKSLFMRVSNSRVYDVILFHALDSRVCTLLLVEG